MEILSALHDSIKAFEIKDLALFPHTVYVEGANVGLASLVNADFCTDIKDCGFLHRKTTKELGEKIFSHNPLEAAIGLASINASLDLRDRVFEIKNANKIVMEKGANGNVSVIGHFPFVERFRKEKICKNLWVFELFPQDDLDLKVEDYEKYLPESDLVLITATTLINHTFPSIYKHLRNSFNVMLGPSTPLSPILFDYKIDVISGTIVTDKEEAKRYLGQGAKYRETKGLEFVSMSKN